MEVVLVIAVLIVAVLVIVGPLRENRSFTQGSDDGGERAELEAAKEAKLGQIREAELDYRTGKLSETDWRVLDGTLRAEAVELLKRLDRLAEPLP